jgi:hypothetical protein
MDFVLAAIPWTFLPGLTLAKREKIGIAIAMSMGIMSVALPVQGVATTRPEADQPPRRAGSVAIVKCVQLPVLETKDACESFSRCPHYYLLSVPSPNFSAVSSVGMYVWDITESTATVIAACIPALRLLVRKESTRIYRTRSLPYKSGGTPRKQSSRDPFVINNQALDDRGELGEHELESGSTGNVRQDRRRAGFPWS